MREWTFGWIAAALAGLGGAFPLAAFADGATTPGPDGGAAVTAPAPAPVPPSVPPAVAPPTVLADVPGDAAALGGYDVLIADRGNNRLLLVSPERQILWSYDFPGLKPGAGADDAFFAEGGASIITNLEHEHVIELIDRATKTVKWSYGELGKPGSGPGQLNFPDDAYMLPNGDVVVADIRNCRILEIAPDKHIVRQAGKTGDCASGPDTLASPNGDKPLPNGHLLVSTIQDQSIIELDENWKQVHRLKLPIKYPSDPQMTAAGNYLVAGYTAPGSLMELTPDGKVVWEYDSPDQGKLDEPSLAMELPNGNILMNDDANDRVVVIDKATSKIVWQYGVKGRPGVEPGLLHIPDGLDIIKAE